VEATTAALLALEAIFTDVARSAEEDEQPLLGSNNVEVESLLRSGRAPEEAAATELSAEPNCTSAVGYRSSSMVEGLLPSMP